CASASSGNLGQADSGGTGLSAPPFSCEIVVPFRSWPSRCRDSDRYLARAHRAEAAGAPAGLAGGRALLDHGLDGRSYDHLRDAHTARDWEVFLAQIDEQHLHLAAIVAI